MDLFELLSKRPSHIRKLRRPKDTEFECMMEIKSIEEDGHKILNTHHLGNDILLVYKCQYDEMDEHHNYWINGLVITPNGIRFPKLKLFAHHSEENELHLADIQIFDDHCNKGYGSILVQELLKLAKEDTISGISGNIKPVDSDHFDRLEHFYKKNGFNVTFNNDRSGGKIFINLK